MTSTAAAPLVKSTAPLLYLVIDRGMLSTDEELLRLLQALARSKIDDPRLAVQLRIKEGNTERRQDLLQKAGDWLAQLSVPSFVNGQTADALSVGSGGVHWPEALIPTVTTHLPDGLDVAASVHSPEAARRASRAGARFVVFGPVFDPGSKPTRGVGVDSLVEVVAHCPVPVLAIGGITPERVTSCRTMGAHGVAVVTGVLHHPHPLRAIDNYLRCFDGKVCSL